MAESRTRSGKPAPPRPKFTQWRATLRQPRMGFLIGIYFLATFCFASLESTLPLLLGSPDFHPQEIANPGQLSKAVIQSSTPQATQLGRLMDADTLEELNRSADSPQETSRET